MDPVDRLLSALRPEHFPRHVLEAVDALLDGEPHPLLDQLREELTMTVTARFYVAEVTRRAYNLDHAAVTLQAAGRGEENKAWAAATPTGQITMTINNPPAAEFFADRLGKDVLLTFEAAEDTRHVSQYSS